MTIKITSLFLLFLTLSFAAFSQSNCKALKGCEKKICELNIKLDIAKKYGNYHQIKGLERAIADTKQNCRTEPINKNFEEKVEEKQEKVLERTEDLNEAIRKQDDASEINRKRRKLGEAKAELREALEAQRTHK